MKQSIKDKYKSDKPLHDSAPKLFIISGHHLIQDWMMMQSYCGLRLQGWGYTESLKDLCQDCILLKDSI